MMHSVRTASTFFQQGLLYPSRPDALHGSAKKPIQTDGDISAKKQMFRPIPPNDRTAKDWTAIGWPTNIQSKTPDGKFGPAKQIEGWDDCWFLAPLAALANNKDNHQILAKSITKVGGGYDVTFKASPHNTVFISDSELDEFVEVNGGDADTRLLQLAADKFFKKKGNFRSVYAAGLTRMGMSQEEAEECVGDYCHSRGRQDPMTYNPMHDGGAPSIMAFEMLTGMPSVNLGTTSVIRLQQNAVMRFLNTYIANNRNGASVVISGKINALGDSSDSQYLLLAWDLIRTDITSNRTLSPQQQAFLNALDKWLETRMSYALEALKSAAGNLDLEHINPAEFVNVLSENLFNLNQDQFSTLRSGVLKVLGGGSGYIGFLRRHAGTIEGINPAADRFTYSEPNYPELVRTGELSDLIKALISGDVSLHAARMPMERSEHVGTSRGRHLRQLHNQVVRDGKIDQAESGPLADLLEMDAGTFRQIYDNDKNGVIEGDELKTLKIRVDRWVEHFELIPIW